MLTKRAREAETEERRAGEQATDTDNLVPLDRGREIGGESTGKETAADRSLIFVPCNC